MLVVKFMMLPPYNHCFAQRGDALPLRVVPERYGSSIPGRGSARLYRSLSATLHEPLMGLALRIIDRREGIELKFRRIAEATENGQTSQSVSADQENGSAIVWV
jgi:hypothetical protein